MFKVEYGLSIQHDVITDAYSNGREVEDPKSFIEDHGHAFSTESWKVRITGGDRRFIKVSFTNGDKTVLKKISRLFTGTLLLGNDNGKADIQIVRDSILSFLYRSFEINAYTKSNPNAVITSTWRSPIVCDDDWEISVLATDGKVVNSVDEDDLIGYCGECSATVTDATWAVVCQESRHDTTAARHLELITERDPFNLDQEFKTWLNNQGMLNFTDLLEIWH